MPRIPFPDVPQLPGVPQLNRSAAFPAGPPPALSGVLAIGRLLQSLFAKPQWGIYAQPPLTEPKDPNADPDELETLVVRGDPQPVVKPDNIVNFSYRQDWTVSDYPVADGGFASYNKVNGPYELQLRLTKGGTLTERTAFIDSIDAIAGTVELYKILTPEKTYLNCNVTRYEVTRRGAQGAYFLAEVDIFFREIRLVYPEYTTSSASTAHSKDPDARPVQNTGSVAALQPSASVVSKIKNRAAELARAVAGR